MANTFSSPVSCTPPLNSLVSRLIARGLRSDLAARLAELGKDLEAVSEIDFGKQQRLFSPDEIQEIQAAFARKEIPPSIIKQLVNDCDWKCCLCWNIDKESAVVIHHIHEHAKTLDDSYENLVLLCSDHHAKAHSKWEISRSPWPPEYIKKRKEDWIKAIGEFKAGRRPRPGREPALAIPFRPVPPPPAGTFIGRRSMLDEIRSLFPPCSSQRLCLVGMAGVGKTATALKVCELCFDHFPGGIFWVDLPETNGDVLSIFRAWRAMCGFDSAAVPDEQEMIARMRSALATHIQNNGAVLFVINDARECWIQELKTLVGVIPVRAPLLLTTREKAVPIAMAVPIKEVAPMSLDEAESLLRWYSKSDLGEGRSITAAILNLLGTLPLAIELVGKHIALNSQKPGFTLESIREKLRVFTTDLLEFPGHPGIVASFRLSYETLSVEERRLFRSLGAFALGSIKVSHVAGVVSANERVAEQQLDRMVSISMLAWGNDVKVYRAHPLLHQYAQYLLAQSNDGQESIDARKRHIRYYNALATTIARHRPTSHDELQEELPNILHAFDQAFLDGRWKIVSNIAFQLWVQTNFLTTRGYDQLSIPILEKAITACQKTNNSPMRAVHLGHLGVSYLRLGKLLKAKAYLEEARDLSMRNRGWYDVSAHLHNLAVVYRYLGELNICQETLQQAWKAAVQGKNAEVLLHVLSDLGGLHRARGDFDKALYFHGEALKIVRLLDDRLGEGNSLSNLGLAYLDKGDISRGEDCIREALEISKEIGDKRGEANRSGHLGNVHLRRVFNGTNREERKAELDAALAYFSEALRITKMIGDRINEANWWGHIGLCYRAAGQDEQAKKHYSDALNMANETGDREAQGRWLLNLGTVQRDLNNIGEARDCLTRSVSIFESLGSRYIEDARLQLNSLPRT